MSINPATFNTLSGVEKRRAIVEGEKKDCKPNRKSSSFIRNLFACFKKEPSEISNSQDMPEKKMKGNLSNGKNYINITPPEIVLKYFSYLNGIDLAKCSSVNKEWKELADDRLLWRNIIHREIIIFGKHEWNRCFGDVGKEPPFSSKNIYKIMKGPCPFFSGSTVQQTHTLVLIPEKVNNEPLTLNNFIKLVNNTLSVYPKMDTYGISHTILNLYGDRITVFKSGWVLLTNDTLRKSEGLSYSQQQKMIQKLSEQFQNDHQINELDYRVPKMIEVMISLAFRYISFRRLNKPFPQQRLSFTQCQETIGSDHVLIRNVVLDRFLTQPYIDQVTGIVAARSIR